MTGEGILVVGIAILVAGLMLREAWCFVTWKRSSGRMERDEWVRLLQTLRDK